MNNIYGGQIVFDEVNIQLACEIFLRRYNNINNPNEFAKIIMDYRNWVGTGAEEYLSNCLYDVFGKKGEKTFYNKIQAMLKPINQRDFFETVYPNNNRTSYAHFGYEPVYVYVESEFEGRYGKQFKVACNCEDELYTTYSRKQIVETFEAGKFYKIALDDIREFGNGYKKFCYDIEEIDEETYIREGIFTRSHLVG